MSRPPSHLPRPARGRPPDPDARAQRRAQIVTGARECFARSGFHAASMAEISRAAGVSVANLYQYFDTKDALVQALVEDDLAQDLAIVGGIARAASFRDGARTAIAESLLQLRDPSYCRLRLELLAEATRNPVIGAVVEKADERMIAALAEILEHARSVGELRFTTSARSASIMALSLFDGLAGRPLPDDAAAALADDCEGFLMAALGAPPAS